jgi:preprotein translocase subunit SecG
MDYVWKLLMVVYPIVCAVLVFLILIQQSKGEGLAGAFGGGGGSQTLFGASTPHVFQKITLYFAVGFLLIAFVLQFRSPKPAYDGQLEGVAPVSTGTGEETTEATAPTAASGPVSATGQ